METLKSEFSDTQTALLKKYNDEYVIPFKKRIAYGTSGFRARAEYLDYIALRVGVFAGIYAKYYQDEAIGVVITASHNPVVDNGLKIVNNKGHMLSNELEVPLMHFVNTEGLEQAIKDLQVVLSKHFSCNVKELNDKGVVFVGSDTRPSSPRLLALLIQGIESQNSKVINIKEVTTPIMHHVVAEYTRRKSATPSDDGNVYVQAYYNELEENLTCFFEHLHKLQNKPRDKPHVLLDCSNGVGFVNIKALDEVLSKFFELKLINAGEEKQFLNDGCGAEFVQKERKLPRNLKEAIEAEFSNLSIDKISFPAFDGDADRLVYYIPDLENNVAKVIEGDKIGALFAKLIRQIISIISKHIIQLQADETLFVNSNIATWSTGAVLTAYANGAARSYFLKELNMNIKIEPTGVKHTHKAAEKFDIGLYFEANGHGTVLIQDKKFEELKDLTSAIGSIRESIKDEAKSKLLEETYNLLKLLVSFIYLANQGAGDAIRNLVMIECALAYLEITTADCAELYIDLPSSTTKIKVLNKDVVQTSYDEERILTPEIIQKEIDMTIVGIPEARAFVRPSGTEDVMRLYVEAKDQNDVTKIVQSLTEFLKQCPEIN